jgi:hypothetical protein
MGADDIGALRYFHIPGQDIVWRYIEPDVRVSPRVPDLRVRRVQKGGRDYYLLFNEGAGTLAFKLELSAKGDCLLLDPFRGAGRVLPDDGLIRLAGHTLSARTLAQS